MSTQPPTLYSSHSINSRNGSLTTTILLHIFSMVLENAPMILPPTMDDPRMALMRVCRRWYYLVCTTPQFWNSLVVYPAPMANGLALVSLFHTFVQRSGNLPLNLYFQTDFHRRNREPFSDLGVEDQLIGSGLISVVDDAIRPYADRIRQLSIVLSMRMSFNFFTSLSIWSFLSLESIQITVVNDVGSPLSSFTIIDYRPFPSLQRLWPAVMPLRRGIAQVFNVPMAWRSITKLNLGNIYIPLDLFMRLLYLTRKSLSAGYFCVELKKNSRRLVDARYKRPFTMLDLSEFRIRVVDAVRCPTFLNHVGLPFIRRLQVEHRSKKAPLYWDIEIYIKWLLPWGKTLKTLKFASFLSPGQNAVLVYHSAKYHQIPYHELAEFLSTLSSLKTLSIPIGIRVHHPILNYISTRKLLPQLEDLELWVDSDRYYVLEMVRARNAGSSMSDEVLMHRVVLWLPHSSSPSEKQLRTVANSLNLSQGFEVSFTPPCPVDPCSSSNCILSA
ncbi:hypothetical protein CVT26_011456 [Gymnopilus dilepis]|uniref:Uncharacterized protein n=1 Tax=Gymnopilus dilepis TaxID=231916 RepID=A0A409VXQ8_9AGAR|nr:hypothetical protein CVT26_011456 [Gymnopilus dilepis]